MTRSIVPPHEKNYFLYYCHKYLVLLSAASKHQDKERSYGTTPQKITSSFRICKNTRISSGQYRLYFSTRRFFLWSARGNRSSRSAHLFHGALCISCSARDPVTPGNFWAGRRQRQGNLRVPPRACPSANVLDSGRTYSSANQWTRRRVCINHWYSQCALVCLRICRIFRACAQ